MREVEGMTTAEMIALGDSFAEAGEPRAAVAVYERAASQSPDNATPLLRMGRLFLDAGDADVAERIFRRSLKRRPDTVAAHLALAQIEILRGATDDALARLESLTDIQGDQLREALNLRGLAHDLAGRHENAQLAYAEALSIKPDSSGAMINLALSLALSGETTAARDILQELAETEDERRRALENLALVHALAGQQAAAMRAAMAAAGDDFARENSIFYRRLATLDADARARAVLLGLLPADSEESAPKSEAEASTALPGDSKPEPEPEPEHEPVPEPQAESGHARTEDTVETTAMEESSAPEYFLQLGSFRDTERVQGHWDSLSTSGLLNDMHGYAAPTPGDDGMMRLLAGPVQGYSLSRERCAEIRQAGHACLVRTAPDGMERLNGMDQQSVEDLD